VPINVIRGKVDFFEILQFRRIGLDDYYDFLNLGQKLTASAGSDLPWGNTMGEARVYAYTGNRFSVDEWFRALKQGRTFVTNGPMLELTVNGALPGDEVIVKPGGPVRIRARAWAPPEIGSPKVLEVIAQGRVIRAAESQSPARKELTLDFTQRAGEGQWIAARVTAHNGALAHTSAVYVTTAGGNFMDRKQLPELIDKRMRILDYIDGRLRDRKFTATYAPGEVAALGERVRQARGLYQNLRRTR
ncbi:MAG: CehA/McbA family metallohydrolase, partial [Acidobacteria bacterium]|nr:CehA/McbA family metallohydrolase [Acidobacteriota bacterium]